MRDMIDMARAAGIKYDLDGVWCDVDQLKAFEALVRADEREIVMNEPLTKAQWQRFEDEIRADEREVLAAEAEKNGNSILAMQLRARGNT